MKFTTHLALHSQGARLDEPPSYAVCARRRRGSHPVSRPVPRYL